MLELESLTVQYEDIIEISTLLNFVADLLLLTQINLLVKRIISLQRVLSSAKYCFIYQLNTIIISCEQGIQWFPLLSVTKMNSESKAVRNAILQPVTNHDRSCVCIFSSCCLQHIFLVPSANTKLTSKTIQNKVNQFLLAYSIVIFVIPWSSKGTTYNYDVVIKEDCLIFLVLFGIIRRIQRQGPKVNDCRKLVKVLI